MNLSIVSSSKPGLECSCLTIHTMALSGGGVGILVLDLLRDLECAITIFFQIVIFTFTVSVAFPSLWILIIHGTLSKVFSIFFNFRPQPLVLGPRRNVTRFLLSAQVLNLLPSHISYLFRYSRIPKPTCWRFCRKP